MIDWARISELREEIGADDFQEIVELFLSEVEDRLETLDANKALSDLEEDLHFLKGSALNLGFERLAALCHEGEAQASSGEAISNVEIVKTTYKESKAAFFAKLDTLRAA